MLRTGTRRIGVALAVVAVTASAGAFSPAAAAGDFGQHVRTCAQTMGFNGEHNPGTHQGFHGWNPDHEC